MYVCMYVQYVVNGFVFYKVIHNILIMYHLFNIVNLYINKNL